MRNIVALKYNPNQPRAKDGKFGSGGGGSIGTIKKSLGRGAASKDAHGGSMAAKGATDKILAGDRSHGAHTSAADAHDAAAKKHLAAAAKSKNPSYRKAHEEVAAAHSQMAGAHRHAASSAAGGGGGGGGGGGSAPKGGGKSESSPEKKAKAPKKEPAQKGDAKAKKPAQKTADKAKPADKQKPTDAKPADKAKPQQAADKAKPAEAKPAEKAKPADAPVDGDKAAKAHEAANKAKAASETAAKADEKANHVPPEHLEKAVDAHLDKLDYVHPKEHEMSDKHEAAIKKMDKHIDDNVGKLSGHEHESVMGFSHGHDYEIRALERGASHESLIQSRMKEGDSRKMAEEHVAKSFHMIKGLHAAQDKMGVDHPPAPALYRGMSVSDRTMHELLTHDHVSNHGMSSSSSLNPKIAKSFANSNAGRTKDYRGDETKHRVVFVIDKAKKSLPMTSAKMSGHHDESEMLLNRDASYKITKRTVSGSHVYIHLEEH